MNFQPQTARTGLKALTPEIFRQERNAVEELRQNPKHSKAWATLASKVRFLSSLFPEAQNPHINPYKPSIRWTTPGGDEHTQKLAAALAAKTRERGALGSAPTSRGPAWETPEP